MKLIALIPLLFIASCASRPTPQIVVKPLPSSAVEPVESVRYAEVIRAYHIGRYVDPHHPDVMHEQHPVYRVEAHTRWNLKPGNPHPAGVSPLNPPKDAAYSPPPTNDVVLAELNRQKDATERVMWEASQLARSYDELQKVIKDMTSVAKNHVFMNARLVSAEQRVAEFEKELQKLTAPLATPTNEVRSFVIEEPDPPKP
jgi:hypothetical protein